MHQMRWLMPLFLAALFTFAAVTFAQPPPPPAELCVLQGTVKFNDGTPFTGVSVTVRVDGKNIQPNPMTDDDGTYTTAVPAGQATVNVVGTEKQIKLEVGKNNTVDFEIAKEGIIVVVTYTDGGVVPNVNLRAAYKLANNQQPNASSVSLGGGRYWFRNLPNDATDLSVVVSYSVGFGDTSIRQQFKLEKPQPMKEVAIKFGKPISFQVAVQDTDGKPLANATVKGTLSYTAPNFPPFFDDPARPPQPASNVRQQSLGDRRTDGNGILDLGTWMPQQYTLILRSGTMAGPGTVIELKAGEAPYKYALSLKPRDVTQTICGIDGKPLPNTEVTLSYCWLNQISYLKTTSDAKGQVVWKGVPPIDALVWGKGVALGLLPADAVNVTKPLDAPVIGNPNDYRWRSLRVKLLDVGDQPTKIVYAYSSGSSGMNNSEMQYRPDPNNPPAISTSIEFRGAAPLFSLIAMTKTIPPKVVTIPGIYIPPIDENSTGEFSISMQPGTSIKGRFVTKAGPIKGLSQFRIVPTKLASDVAGLFNADFQRRAGLMQPTLNADGTFSAALPGPGSYRLVVDLYDEAVTPLPDLLVEVPNGGKDVEIKLPDPMLQVPAGTQLNWLTTVNPANARRLVAAAHANPTPIFGPREQLLAMWFRPTPDKLVFWNGLDRQQSILTLRTAYINVLDDAGSPYPYGNSYSLLPLLPTRDGYYGGSNDMLNRASSEMYSTTLSSENRYCAAIWGGRYLLPMGQMDNRITKFTAVDIPADGPAEINITMKQSPFVRIPQRYVQVRYGRNDAEEMRKSATEYIGVYFDTTATQEPERNLYYSNLRQDGGSSVQVPLNAKTMTIHWLGVGIMRNIPLPEFKPDQQATVDLPAWEPLATVSGRILMADGKPYANRQFQAGIRSNDSSWTLRAQTDADGNFTVKGVMPGTFFVFTDSDYQGGGWTLNVPEKGLTGLTLKMAAQSIRISNIPSGDNGQAWWFPDGGQPVRLPMRYGNCSVFDLPLMSGMLWGIDGNRGEGRYMRMTLRPGEQYLNSDSNNPATGPTLGIYFPLDLEKGTPGPLTLVGLEDRANLKVRFSYMNWQASTLLNRVVGQINAVPPGKYKVVVETSTGNVEATVTITDSGGKVEMNFPPAPAAPAAPAAGADAGNGPVFAGDMPVPVEGLHVEFEEGFVQRIEMGEGFDLQQLQQVDVQQAVVVDDAFAIN